MRTPDVPDNEIIEAGKKLQNDGRRVTGWALRKTLGGGNANRLFEVWENYLANINNGQPGDAPALSSGVEEVLSRLNQNVADQLRDFAKAINAAAVQEAQKKIEEVTAASIQAKEQAEAELADAATVNSDLEEQVAYLRAERIKTGDELRKANKELLAANTEKAELKSQLAILEHEKKSLKSELAAAKTPSEDREAILKEKDDALAKAREFELALLEANAANKALKEQFEKLFNNLSPKKPSRRQSGSTRS